MQKPNESFRRLLFVNSVQLMEREFERYEPDMEEKMDRRDEIQFLRKFRAKVNQYLFLGFSPPEGLIFSSKESKKMHKALKKPEFQKLHNAIREMAPQAHKILKKYHINAMWRQILSQTDLPTIGFDVFNLVIENETNAKISKEIFLERIDITIEAVERADLKGVVLVALSADNQLLEDMYDAIERAAIENHLIVKPIEHLDPQKAENTLKSLKYCEYFVVDLTYPEPHIWFEIGYAFGVGKSPVCIARKGTEINFEDLFHSTVFFETMDELKRKVSERLLQLKREKEEQTQ